MRFPSQNLTSPSNTCANYCLLLGSQFLDFLGFYNTFETLHWADLAYGGGPWSEGKKCAKRYVFQVENRRSCGPMISNVFSMKNKKCHWSPAILPFVRRKKADFLFVVGRLFDKKKAPCWDTLFSQTCTRVREWGLKWKPFLTMNGKGVDRTWISLSWPVLR